MVRLREIPRTAAFTWSPGASTPFLATGTKAGAVDADFSSDTQLELWDLDLDNVTRDKELKPAASIATDSRFHDIAWVQSKDGPRRGVIAGALESGSLDLWDVDKLLRGEESLMSRTTKHTGAIKALQFNPFRPELLATAGAKGELYISDTNNIENPFRLGNTAARADDFECLEWNKKVPHIMATGSSGGFVTVWDVRAKKETLTLNNYGRKPVGAIAWDPTKSTRLITAVPLDTDPLILVWDLRNSNAPERVLQGHEGGVLSLSWCQQDPDLLLSCGKDNRTICWNPQSGETYGEFSVVTNWTFQTRWNPHNPSLLATASFDGKIAVQTLQNTKGSDASTTSASQALDGEDFFNKAQTQPQASSFSLPNAPKWLERPCGVSFGFGGKVLSFSANAESRVSSIRITNFAVDPTIGRMTEDFETAMSDKNISSFCEQQIEKATAESEKTDWRVIETLTAGNPRKELIKYLGVSVEDAEVVDSVSQAETAKAGDDTLAPPQTNGTKNNRLSAFFDNNESDNFLSTLASTKGAKTNNPFHVYSDDDAGSDKKITQALILGKFDRAMEICLQEDRLSDAFMIAICGGKDSIDKVQQAYFKKQSSGPKYLRLLASVVGKNLWDIVYNADLKNWREVMATLCTYASAEEFPDLCEALGDRLEEELGHNESNVSLRQDASFCYIAGSKLEKVVGVWIAELQDKEQNGLKQDSTDSSFSVHARSLQAFIEKVSVFREVTHYQDRDRSATSNWKLAPLYEKYTEYADILAAHGQLQVAEKYLDLLPEKYPAADVARNRVKQATKKAAVPLAARQQASTLPVHRTQPGIPSFEDQRAPAFSASSGFPAPAPFASQAPAQSQYAPQAPNPYSAVGYQPQQPMQPPGRTQFGIPQPPPFGVAPQPQSLGPPPRNINTSPSIPPPSKDKNMVNWNDTPEDFFKGPSPRKGTPAAQPTVITPFPNAVAPTPPMAGQPFQPPRAQQQAPPPPRNIVPPPRTMTPQMHQVMQAQAQTIERPSSSAANAYAPQYPNSQLGAMQPQAPIARGNSPYNVPPPVASMPPGPPPTGSRYAPAPVQQQAAPPAQRVPPPPNPYVGRQSFSGAQDMQAGGPPPGMGQNMNQGPPPTARPTPPPARPSKPATPKFPPGDRSHIPANALPIFEILRADMQRVRSKAPKNFEPQVKDTEKRLDILFDNLNNETLLKPGTIQEMVQLSEALRAKNYDQAQEIHLSIVTQKSDECGAWMTGVKRLIAMSKATP